MRLDDAGPLLATDSDVAPPAVDPVMYLSRAEPLLGELEESWARGVAGPVLEECSTFLAPSTLKGYQELIRKGAPPSFRRGLLAKLLKQFAHHLRPPLHVFPASESVRQDLHPSEPGPAVPSISGLFVESAEVPRIRLDQAFAARRWGVWYALGSPESQARLEASWSRSVIETFEVNLRAMNRLHREARLDKAIQNEDLVGFWFEQLVLDILNEERHQARRAPLDEDLCERTDLRVTYPTLERNRGARVQVTLLTDEVRHGAKLRRIKRADEFVVVSPIMLAGAALGLVGKPSFTLEQKDGFFAALPRSAQSVGEVAMALKSHFLRALGNPASPLGPVLSVAAPIRRFIRGYVQSEAHDSTRQLRRREYEGGSPGYNQRRREK